MQELGVNRVFSAAIEPFSSRNEDNFSRTLKKLPELAAANTLTTATLNGADQPYFYCQSNGGILTRIEFALKYAQAAANIINRSRELVLSGENLDQLNIRLASFDSEIPFSIDVPDRSEWQALSATYEDGIREKIVRIANGLEPRELEYRALQLATLVSVVAHDEIELECLLQNGGLDKLRQYQELMREARSDAGSNAESALGNFAKLVKEKFGYHPDLVVFQDFDGNLTKVPESGSPWKPGEPTNQLINEIDRILNLPIYLRLALTESPGLDVNLRKLAGELYSIAARESEFYPDVQRLFKKLDSDGTEHWVLTANHRDLVQTKLLQSGVSCNGVIGMSSTFWYGSKVDFLLKQIILREKFATVLFSDDNDRMIASHLKGSEHDHLPPDLPLYDCMFLSTRKDNGHSCRVADALEPLNVPHLVNRLGNYGSGLRAMHDFIRRHKILLHAGNSQKHHIRIPDDYAVGDIVRSARTQHELGYAPKAEQVTLIKPLQDETKVGNQQYDLGVPTAARLKNGEWVVLYKAAAKPSGFAALEVPSPSNVFAAKLTAKGICYFDRRQTSDVSVGVEPLLTSSLSSKYSRDGLHDPRVTFIPELGSYLILACAFNKLEEQRSIAEARGDITKPIRGAVTELFIAKSLEDPSSYQSLGLFGPDHHFKNMVFFPELITVEGEKHLLLLTRKMPGIQAIPVPLTALNPESWAREREQFWQKNLALERIRGFSIMNPYLPHEGNNNPFAPMKVGQIAPGLPPAAVSYNGKDYWLMVYNAVPDFSHEKNGSPYGRVISCALLDRQDPWKLISRSPIPIVVPRPASVFMEDEGLKPRHVDIAFCGGGGVDSAGKLCIFYTEMDTTIACSSFNVTELLEFLIQFDEYGRLKR